MIEQLDALQARVDAERPHAATEASLGIGSILDIITEVIAVVRAVVSHTGLGGAPPAAPPST